MELPFLFHSVFGKVPALHYIVITKNRKQEQLHFNGSNTNMTDLKIKIENTAEQIIANIARTSFPHKKIKVICPDSASNQKGHSRQLIQRAIDSCSLAGGGHVIISKDLLFKGKSSTEK